MKPGTRLNRGKIVVCALTFGLLASNLAPGPAAEKDKDPLAEGKELFTREWLAGDRRSHAGDGLGPLFNARSCAACHHLGGIGGAGADTTIITVSVMLATDKETHKAYEQPNRDKLAEQIHPALRTRNSFPLHRYSTEKEFLRWRVQVFVDPYFRTEDSEAWASLEYLHRFSFGQWVDKSFVELVSSERNPPALFGAGLIDRIPAQVLEEVAACQARFAQKSRLAKRPSKNSEDASLPVSGRVARLKDGRIGRFGWKAQTATLREFTLLSCAVEIGLEVPGYSQASPPWKPDYKAPGLDLSVDQCDWLVKFLASLPPPQHKPPETALHAAEIDVGQKLFERIGCAICHQPKLGDVEGIYSDLLLHDMGKRLSDDGVYGESTLARDGDKDHIDPLRLSERSGSEEVEKQPKFGASSREWRTLPLWGVRDSAPYLHDGRAEAISSAIMLHGGEGLESARQFRRMPLRERQQLELFLQSLGVPTEKPE